MTDDRTPIAWDGDGRRYPPTFPPTWRGPVRVADVGGLTTDEGKQRERAARAARLQRELSWDRALGEGRH